MTNKTIPRLAGHQIESMRSSGMSWSDIAQEHGVSTVVLKNVWDTWMGRRAKIEQCKHSVIACGPCHAIGRTW